MSKESHVVESDPRNRPYVSRRGVVYKRDGQRVGLEPVSDSVRPARGWPIRDAAVMQASLDCPPGQHPTEDEIREWEKRLTDAEAAFDAARARGEEYPRLTWE